MQVGRRGRMHEHLCRLEQPEGARRSLRVAEVGLERTDHQPAAAALAKRLVQSAHLNRIAERRAGAVSLEEAHRRRLDRRVRHRRRHDSALRRSARRRQRHRPAVLVDRRPCDEGDRRAATGCAAAAAAAVTVIEVENEAHARLGAHVPVGVGVEGLAAAVGCEHPRVTPRRERAR